MNQSAPKKRTGSASRAENCLPDTSKASAGFCGVARLCTGRNLTKFAVKANQECFVQRCQNVSNKSRQTRLTEGAVQLLA